MGTSAAGIENVVREFQKQINEKRPEFNPNGLEEWVTNNSGVYNDNTRDITEKIEFSIRENVYNCLKDKFGTNWWSKGVPKDIQITATTTAITKDNLEPPQNFVFLLDYKKMIEKNWDIFENIYADPEIKNGKEKQLSWFNRLSDIRNKVSHPGRAKVTQDEFEFLSNLRTWLFERINEISSI